MHEVSNYKAGKSQESNTLQQLQYVRDRARSPLPVVHQVHRRREFVLFLCFPDGHGGIADDVLDQCGSADSEYRLDLNG